ncbi:MAG: rhodanese-like domain-containing protein [Nocardioidaceae bacterium]|nr:rhodanese-like domain-containing protein [Nocardioidaceae bacterium]
MAHGLHEVPEVEMSGVPDELPASLVVVDVREDAEWTAGHIEPATHIPLMELSQRFDEVPTDRQVLVVCRSGARSAQATAFLQAQGCEAVNLAGGMKAWQTAGRAMTSERDAPPDVI